MAKRKENEVLYRTIRQFFESCLLNDNSLLWPEIKCWTTENLQDIKARMVDSPIWGDDLTFEEKLKKQMEGATKNQWAVICDIYFIYFMPSTFITFEKKYRDISKAANLGGLTSPPEDVDIWQAQRYGFTRTAMKYHYKYSQFWLLIKFALSVKNNKEPESVIKNFKIMQQCLDECLASIENRNDRAYDMRHAILYMAFPDEYERIISTEQKRKIYERYRNLIDQHISSDLDERILLIRKALSKQYDKADGPFDFYSDLESEWRTKSVIDKKIFKEITEEEPIITVPPKDDSSCSEVETEKEISEHTGVQWLLLKLGNDMGLDIWVAKNDKNKEYNGQKFSDFPKIKTELPLKFDAYTKGTIELIDVLWIEGPAIKAAFEIETTTSIYSGLLRMADLISMLSNLNIKLYLVAPEKRREKFMYEIKRPVFSMLPTPLKEVCKFITIESLKKEIEGISSKIRYLKPNFIDSFAESFEPESDESD